jgi:hypothetical protein
VALISVNTLEEVLRRRGAPSPVLAAFQAVDTESQFRFELEGGAMPAARAFASASELHRQARASSASEARSSLAGGPAPAPGRPPSAIRVRAEGLIRQQLPLLAAPPARPAQPPARLARNMLYSWYGNVVEDQHGYAEDFSDEEGEPAAGGGRRGPRPAPFGGHNKRRATALAAAEEAEAEEEEEEEEEGVVGHNSHSRLLRDAFRREADHYAALERQQLYRPVEAARLGGQQAANMPSSQRLTLKRESMPASLKRELDVFAETAQDPGVNLLRANVFTTRVADSTMDRLMKDIRKYLGYVHYVKGRPLARLSLSSFSEVPILCDYLDYLEQRGVRPTELKVQATTASKVTQFLVNLVERNGPEAEDLRRSLRPLQYLQQELAHKIRREKGATVRDEVLLPPAGKVLAFVERVADNALERVSAAQQAGRLLNEEDVLAVRDASMLAFTIGHVGLTVRISATRTVKAPDFAQLPCTVSGCTQPNCCGNRLCIKAEGAAGGSDDPAVAKYVVELPHHKNTGRGVAMPPIPIESAKLERLLDVWLGGARAQVGC